MSTYVCGECGASGVKLWREYQTFNPKLLCGACALADQGKEGPIDAGGFRRDQFGVMCDQIGWYVPAVPCDETGVEGFWGYTSVPEPRVKWWRDLPLEAP